MVRVNEKAGSEKLLRTKANPALTTADAPAYLSALAALFVIISSR